MNAYQLGANLRRQILGDLERGLPMDGRRLQALVGDFCGAAQSGLLPALKYLVSAPAFSSAVAQRPPLPADGRLQLRLQQELNQVFAAPIPPPQASRGRGLVAVLSFMAGVLMVAVAGGLAWLLLQSRQQQALMPGAPPTVGQPVAGDEPQTESAPAIPPPPPNLNQADVSQAIASVEALYAHLTGGNSEAARQLVGGEAADQFDPSFFNQFQRVRVTELRETSRLGSSVTLEGVVRFDYPDGTTQSESRSFTVDTASQPALITASSFLQVLRARDQTGAPTEHSLQN